MKSDSLPRLSLLVLRADDPPKLAEFYSSLGLTFSAEQHGKGPLHYAADCAGIVIEIYPLAHATESTASTRLGFTVTSIHSIQTSLEAAGAVLVSPVGSSLWGKRAVFRDPAGHCFELLEEETRPALSEVP